MARSLPTYASQFNMFGPLGLPELLFILGLALLVFGPKRLPEVGRTLGKGLAEFRKASTELRRSINTELMVDEIRESDPRRWLREDLDEGRSRRPPGMPQPEAAEAADSAADAASTGPALGKSVDPRTPSGERVARGTLSPPAAGPPSPASEGGADGSST